MLKGGLMGGTSTETVSHWQIGSLKRMRSLKLVGTDQ